MPAVFSYAGFRASIVHSILPSVYTDTQAIVETGCGFGRNIWDLINHGLDTDIDVWCMEYTPSGRNAARLVAKVPSNSLLITCYLHACLHVGEGRACVTLDASLPRCGQVLAEDHHVSVLPFDYTAPTTAQFDQIRQQGYQRVTVFSIASIEQASPSRRERTLPNYHTCMWIRTYNPRFD